MVDKITLFRRIAVIALLLLLSNQALAAGIQARLDKQTTYEGDAVTLTVEVTGSSNSEPDFKPLEKDFEIIGRSKRQEMYNINGKMSHVIKWVLPLLPKRKGQLMVPALRIGQSKTRPIPLHVKPASASTAGNAAKEMFLQVKVDPASAWVQSQIIYSVRIYIGIRMNGVSLSEPKISQADAVVTRLGDDKQFETTHLGRRYIVIERHYAIFPQQSGKLRIDPLVFSGRVSNGSSQFFDPFNQRGQVKRIRSQAIEIDVKSIPANQQALTWLPATEVKLEERWPEDPPQFKVGDAVTRTLLLTAQGLTAVQLPELSKAIPDGFKSYPDQAELNDQQQATGITGTRTEKIALIASRPGHYTLPEIKLHWWNTQTDKQEVTRIPARKIVVLAAEGSKKSNVSDTTVNKSVSTNDAAKTSSSTVNAITATGYWPLISLFLAIGWLGTLGFIAYRISKTKSIDKKILADIEIRKQQSFRQAERNIKQACQRNDAQACKEALLQWARLHYPQDNPGSLGVIGKYLSSELDVQVSRLNQVLYSQAADDWQGEALWQAWQQADKNNSGSSDNKTPALSPLYP